MARGGLQKERAREEHNGRTRARRVVSPTVMAR